MADTPCPTAYRFLEPVPLPPEAQDSPASLPCVALCTLGVSSLQPPRSFPGRPPGPSVRPGMTLTLRLPCASLRCQAPSSWDHVLLLPGFPSQLTSPERTLEGKPLGTLQTLKCPDSATHPEGQPAQNSGWKLAVRGAPLSSGTSPIRILLCM